MDDQPVRPGHPDAGPARSDCRRRYEAVDYELQTIADLQQALLPAELPRVPGLELAAHYQTANRAGGDYYDFFPLPGGRLGCWWPT